MHGDEIQWNDLTLPSKVVDLLMFPKIRISPADLELMLAWIDQTCFENHADNLNVDPITEIYHPIEWVYFIWPWGPGIPSISSQFRECQMLLLGRVGHNVVNHLGDLVVIVVTPDDVAVKRGKGECDETPSEPSHPCSARVTVHRRHCCPVPTV